MNTHVMAAVIAAAPKEIDKVSWNMPGIYGLVGIALSIALVWIGFGFIAQHKKLDMGQAMTRTGVSSVGVAFIAVGIGIQGLVLLGLFSGFFGNIVSTTK